MSRSVVDIGMEILRAEGALQPVPVVEAPETEPEDDDEEEPDQIAAMKALADQLTVLADRLAVKDTLDMLSRQVSRLTELVVQLQVYTTQPRIKVPVRDEAGRITEVREIVAPNEPADGL
jgi:hypothetical protein